MEMCFDICIYTSIQQLNMHYDFLIKTMFGSSLSPVLFRLCQYVLCFSLDCPFFIATSVFSNVYYYYYLYILFSPCGPKIGNNIFLLYMYRYMLQACSHHHMVGEKPCTVARLSNRLSEAELIWLILSNCDF